MCDPTLAPVFWACFDIRAALVQADSAAPTSFETGSRKCIRKDRHRECWPLDLIGAHLSLARGLATHAYVLRQRSRARGGVLPTDRANSLSRPVFGRRSPTQYSVRMLPSWADRTS